MTPDSYKTKHYIYYDPEIAMRVCRRFDNRKVESTRLGGQIDHTADIDTIVKDFFEGEQVVKTQRNGPVIMVTTLHKPVDLEA